MAYRSADIRWPDKEITGIVGDKVRIQNLGHGTGAPSFVGIRLGVAGWIELPADTRARYGVVISGVVVFQDDGGALEVVTRCQTFAALPNKPLALRTGDGCELFIVEMDSVSAPAPYMDDRQAELRARQAALAAEAGPPPKGPVRTWWGRLARRRPRLLGRAR